MKVTYTHTLTPQDSNLTPNQLTELFNSFSKIIHTSAYSFKPNKLNRLIEIFYKSLFSLRGTDIVHIDMYSGSSIILTNIISFFARLFKKKLIIMLHGGNLPVYYKDNSSKINKILNRADVIIAPSNFLKNWVESIGYQCRVIPNIIHVGNYDSNLRTSANLNIFWMRKFHLLWNPEMAVRAIDIVSKSFPNVKLYMAGKDEGDLDRIKNLITELNLNHNIEIAGFLNPEQKREYFNKCDIYLHTNLVDNTPVSVIEACASGQAVIASNVGGMPYILEDEVNTLFVEKNDHKMMAEKIIRLFNEPHTIKKLSENGKLLAEQSSWEFVKEKWLSLYKELTN
jgi:glycosyltransferase involved in cell wall biosynthesis